MKMWVTPKRLTDMSLSLQPPFKFEQEPRDHICCTPDLANQEKRWWISSMASIIENQSSMVSGRMRVAFSSLESNKTSCQRPALSQARSATYWQRTARLQDSNSLTMRRWRWRVWAVAAWERRGVPLGKVRGTSIQTSAIDCCTELLTSHWYTVFGGFLVPPSWDA